MIENVSFAFVKLNVFVPFVVPSSVTGEPPLIVYFSVSVGSFNMKLTLVVAPTVVFVTADAYGVAYTRAELITKPVAASAAAKRLKCIIDLPSIQQRTRLVFI